MEVLLTLTIQHELLFLPSLRQVSEPEHRIAGNTLVDQAVRIGGLPAQGLPSACSVMVEQLVRVSRLDVVPVIVRYEEHVEEAVAAAEVEHQRLGSVFPGLVGGQHITVGHALRPVSVGRGGRVNQPEGKLPAGAVFVEGYLRHGHVEAGGDGLPAEVANRPIRSRHHDMAVRLQRTGKREQGIRKAEFTAGAANHPVAGHAETALSEVVVKGVFPAQQRTGGVLPVRDMEDRPTHAVHMEGVSGKAEISGGVPVHREEADARLQVVEGRFTPAHHALTYGHEPAAAEDAQQHAAVNGIRDGGHVRRVVSEILGGDIEGPPAEHGPEHLALGSSVIQPPPHLRLRQPERNQESRRVADSIPPVHARGVRGDHVVVGDGRDAQGPEQVEGEVA